MTYMRQAIVIKVCGLFRDQAIFWTDVGLFSNKHLGKKFTEILIEIQTFLFNKINLEMSAKWQPLCLGLDV